MRQSSPEPSRSSGVADLRGRVLWLALGWAMVAAVVWGSLTPAPPQAGNDKIGHFAAYGVLMFWFAQLYLSRLACAAGFIALGIALEFAQGWLGYRSFELYDMVADALGVLLGWAGAWLLKKPLFKEIRND